MDKRLLSLAAVLGLTLAGCTSTLTKEELVETENQCMNLFKKRNYTEAFPFCEKACANNGGLSCLVLGVRYELGLRLEERDYLTAAQYYEKSCELKNNRGCFYIGKLYKTGTGVKQDYKLSANFFKKSCDLNNGFGCSN